MAARIAKSERNVLTAVHVKGLQAPGMYADGGNLYLQIGPTGAKSWIFRYYNAGKRYHMGLGPLVDVSLKLAREKAADQRELLRQGKDPILERGAARTETHRQLNKSKTFSQCVDSYIDAKSAEWTVKHMRQWQSTLTQYASKLGNVLIADIDREHVMNVLTPIWQTRNTTANRVRGRMENVLAWATVMGYRHGENPARWKGNLDHLLARPSKVAPPKHLRALPFVNVGNFMGKLRTRIGGGAKALEFCILTAARTTEALECRWSEIDLETKIWTIPPERMKSGVTHVVPLSKRAVEIITDSPTVGTDFVFPGQKHGAPLSNTAMLKSLKRMGYKDLTVHGFRSTFRDWAAEETTYTNEVVAMALAHTIGDKTEAAYRRGELLPKRRNLMDDWATYCDTPTRNIVAMPNLT